MPKKTTEHFEFASDSPPSAAKSGKKNKRELKLDDPVVRGVAATVLVVVMLAVFMPRIRKAMKKRT